MTRPVYCVFFNKSLKLDIEQEGGEQVQESKRSRRMKRIGTGAGAGEGEGEGEGKEEGKEEGDGEKIQA